MNWQKFPFIRLLLPLITGLLFAFYSPNIQIAWVASFVFLGSVIILLVLAWLRQLNRSTIYIWGGLLMLCLFCLGYSRCYFSEIQHNPQHLSHYIDGNIEQNLIARVLSEPKLRENSIGVDLEVLQVQDSLGKWHFVKGKIKASVALDSAAAGLSYGAGLWLRAKIKPLSGPQNPHAYDPRPYNRRQGIYHRTYLREGYWKQHTEWDGGHPLWKQLIAWRGYLLSNFEEHLAAAPNELAVASALVLGARNELSTELRNAYADTGATHVLAVSGLHVGLIVLGLGFLLDRYRPRKRRRRWRVIKTVLILLGIWLFALLTGASPSVLRASTMFSFVAVGQALQRQSSIYNTLAASAFLLLLIEPLSLWDVGFQLSYLAVAGIVYLQPKIYKSWYVPNKIGDWVWNLTAVSLAAQIATLPISLYYFHQFPTYFWLSGLVVIPMATIILPLGIVVLVLGKVPLLGWLLGQFFYWAIALMNACIFRLQQLPFATLEGFWLESWEMGLWYAVIILVLIGAHLQRYREWMLAACCLLVLAGMDLWRTIQHTDQQQVVVYQQYRGTTLDFIWGNRAVTLVDSLHNTEQQLHWTNQQHLWARGVDQHQVLTLDQDSLSTASLWLNRLGIGQFGNYRFAIFRPDLLNAELVNNAPLTVDFLLLRGNPKLYELARLEELFDYDLLVFDASNSPWRVARWREECLAAGIPFVDCSKKGMVVFGD